MIKKESLFLEKVVQIVQLPDTYDILIDEPLKYFVEGFKEHNLTIAIGIHEDILIELPRLISESSSYWRTKNHVIGLLNYAYMVIFIVFNYIKNQVL